MSSVLPVLHSHLVQFSLFTQGPQQSPRSKPQWKLLLKSWQKPSPTNSRNWQSVLKYCFSSKMLNQFSQKQSLKLKGFFTSRNTSRQGVWNGNGHKHLSWNRQLLAQGRNCANHVGAGKKIYLILSSITIKIASNYCLSMDQWHHGVPIKWDRHIWS